MKKVLPVLLAGFLSLNLASPVWANEEIEEEVIVEEEAEEEIVEQDEIEEKKQESRVIQSSSSYGKETSKESNDELFAHYVDEVFSGIDQENEITKHSAGYKNLDGKSFEIYCELYEFVKSVANGESESTSISLDIRDREYLFDLSWENEEEDFNYLNDFIMEDLDIIQAKECLLVDCPYELYWYDKSHGFFTSYRIETDEQGYTYVTDLIMKFTPCQEFAGTESFSVDTSKTGAAILAAENAAKIVDDATSYDDYNKLLFYNDAICFLTDYNYDAIKKDYDGGYGNPWQMIYVFDGDYSTKVVCEGYAKAFKYLCDLSTFAYDIDCRIVTGPLGSFEEDDQPGGHMWNVVQMEDGKNYLVDVTNSDQKDYDGNPELFLRGSVYDHENDFYPLPVSWTTLWYRYDPEMYPIYSLDELELSMTDYGYKEPSMTIEKSSYILEPGESTQILVKSDCDLSFQSSDEEIVSVDQNGQITAISNGEATIEITTDDGEKESVNVKVQNAIEYLGMNMTLTSDVTMNYYFTFIDSMIESDTSYLHFVRPNGKELDIDVSDAQVLEEDGVTEYKFSCDISPKDLTGYTTFTLMDDEEERSQMYMVTAVDYLYFLVEELEGTKDAYIADVLLKYGYFTQEYFEYKLDQLPNYYSDLGSTSLEDYAYTLTDQSDAIDFVGARLVLTAKPAIKVYFDTSLDTITIDGQTISLIEDGDYKYCRIYNIEDFSDMWSFSAPNFELQYGIFSYGYSAQKTNKQSLKNLVQAMYDYNNIFY